MDSYPITIGIDSINIDSCNLCLLCNLRGFEGRICF